MNERDEFSVWVAETVLRANGDEISAATVSALSQQAQDGLSLDDVLAEAASSTKRPGDFGVEFVGPLLPILLVEFGRLLWDAYSKALVDEGGKALAEVTVGAVKKLLRRTFAHEDGALSEADAIAELRKAGHAAGLDEAQIEKLLEELRRPEAVSALAEG